MSFEREGRSPSFAREPASSGARAESPPPTRAQEAQGYVRTLELNVRAVERSLTGLQTVSRDRSPASEVAGDKLRRSLRVAAFMRAKAAPLLEDATPEVQQQLRALF